MAAMPGLGYAYYYDQDQAIAWEYLICNNRYKLPELERRHEPTLPRTLASHPHPYRKLSNKTQHLLSVNTNCIEQPNARCLQKHLAIRTA
ncbi:hypothetical protein [Nostoc sp.]|uniref:hypothetical protein n=1 Tax=Nostoc sp. TaxID=1180 RepID=UPI002FF97342